MSDLPRLTGRWRYAEASVVRKVGWFDRVIGWSSVLAVQVEELRKPGYPRSPNGEVAVWRYAAPHESRYLKPENEVQP